MSRSLIFREGQPDDLNGLATLALASYGQYREVLTPENWERLHLILKDPLQFQQLSQKGHVFVCSHQNNIVGMAFLIPSGTSTEIYDAAWCQIRMVGVHPDFAGQGIARKLVNNCIDKARRLGETTIALHTSEFMDAARHIYEDMGFKMLREIPVRFGKRYWLYTLSLN